MSRYQVGAMLICLHHQSDLQSTWNTRMRPGLLRSLTEQKYDGRQTRQDPHNLR
ncbi:hypothetical protein PC118_g25675 [Phytophthora cactorum]|uniref:Uncharacterized protein n=1 Tax=Phytophthora cactorum TaxID=29920 RepID=A0A8T1DXD1_9STRA|nr:hypothetical protein PC118_g25675 [Phytophthora cactorum]